MRLFFSLSIHRVEFWQKFSSSFAHISALHRSTIFTAAFTFYKQLINLIQFVNFNYFFHRWCTSRHAFNTQFLPHALNRSLHTINKPDDDGENEKIQQMQRTLKYNAPWNVNNMVHALCALSSAAASMKMYDGFIAVSICSFIMSTFCTLY